MPKGHGIGFLSPPGTNPRGSRAWFWVFVAVVCGFVGWAVWAAINLRQQPPPPIDATVSQITDSPNDFYGKRVLLTTVVNRVLGPHSFTAGNGGLLVVSTLPLPNLGPGSPVQVSGTVRRFNLAEIDREIASPLNNAELASWAGKPAVIAMNVNPFRVGQAVSPARMLNNGQSGMRNRLPHIIPIRSPGAGRTR